jgi:hypothetical protein
MTVIIPSDKWSKVVINGKVEVRLTCPLCGLQSLLDHEIAADGTVTPSVVCPGGTSCTWHEVIKLEGWKP